MTRTVFVKADGVARPHKFEGFSGATYGEFKQFVKDQGSDLSFDGNKRIVLKSSGSDLVDDNAKMSDVDNDVIFIMVDKMENGASYDSLTYAELKEQAREIVLKDGDNARAYFGSYHMVPRLALVALLNGYVSAAPQTAVVAETVEDTDEMIKLRAAYGDLLAAMNELGEVLLDSTSEQFGGFSLDDLNADWEAHNEATKKRRG